MTDKTLDELAKDVGQVRSYVNALDHGQVSGCDCDRCRLLRAYDAMKADRDAERARRIEVEETASKLEETIVDMETK